MSDEFAGREHLVKKRSRVIIMERLWRGFIIFLALLGIVLLAINSIQGRLAREDLLSCTIPGRECYERSQERMEETIDVLFKQGIDREMITRQIIVLAAACAGDVRIKTAEAIEDCVNTRLVDEYDVHLGETP